MVRAQRRPFQIVPLTGDRLQSVCSFATPKFMLDNCGKLWYNSFCNCGYSTSASISAFQAEDVGSTPISRSKTKLPNRDTVWEFCFGLAVTFLPLYFTFCALDKGAGKPHNKY